MRTGTGGPTMQGCRRAGVAAAAILALLAGAGCAPDGKAPADAAQSFHRALAASDWASACSMLLEDTRQKAAQEQHSSCEDRLQNLQLEDVEAVTGTETYGRNAMVVFDNDTVFLTAARGGWKITAAGCTPEGEAPYTCEVGGK
ncbi:hypothetical protein [Pseudarthrobacter phenanthrenivorans]|uniref:hypothetical protein n=1 Tax=Pseudarthrobacter phenanthrenivorans TaxID=361575 RepID=UPI0011C3FE0C|nr:hypothetical protein [Pseudarthrobacter phenanthrenivorans]